MAISFSPGLEDQIHEAMSTAGYGSVEELVSDALLALDDVRARKAALQDEITARLASPLRAMSKPLDLAEVKKEARQRVGIIG